MLKRIHEKLLNRSEAYRDWHRSSWSSLKNASFMLMFSLLIAGVTWYARNPQVLVEESEKQVLGATIGPKGEIIEQMQIVVTPMGSDEQNEYSFTVQTSRPADVWVEYDDEYNGEFFKLKSTTYGSYHLFTLPDLQSRTTYVFRVGAIDEYGVEQYSRPYSFTN